MKKIILLLISITLIFTCCSVPSGSSGGGGSGENNGEINSIPIKNFDDLVYRVCNSTIKVSIKEADDYLMPSYDTGELGKWVFCDYYTANIDDVTSSFIMGGAGTNDWGADIWGDGTPESGHFVSGVYDRTIRFIFYVDGISKFHVYEYLPYGSDYSGKNLWFGETHIFYLDPVDNGQIAIGAPYLELFPDISNNDILEVRVEKTSYYEYRGLHAGNHDINEDPGSTMQEMISVLGNPLAAVYVNTMEDIAWDNYNNLYIFDNNEGGYIHYVDQDNTINARIFLRKLTDNNYHIIAIYMRDFRENN